MIRYTLRCPEGHEFDSWFKSASAFDALRAGGHVTCAVCGAGGVEKALMAPRVRAGRDRAAPAAPDDTDTPARDPAPQPQADTPLSQPASETERRIAALRAHVEANSDDVGLRFAEEARRMHSGDAPARAIHGEAKFDEARALIDEGVPVAPLPFRRRRDTN
ncbi:DUF1178 domain-containing protein [Rhodobacteraceae bacterium WD3A24]|nr:DUF1178 domain-containing protein [Rhodobacteraceae bacterium WD3A24]